MANGDDTSGGSIQGLSGDGTAAGTGTGRFGVVAGQTGGTVSSALSFSDLWAWINKPFTTPLSTINIFLIVGVIIIAIILWNIILFHIRIAAEEIV